MPRKIWTESGFGERLVALRKARGLTQVQLAEAIDATQRAISYYETHEGYPPAPVVAQLARALDVTADELLGVAKAEGARAAKAEGETAEARRLWKRFQQVLALPEKDQRAVMRLVSSLASAHGSKEADA